MRQTPAGWIFKAVALGIVAWLVVAGFFIVAFVVPMFGPNYAEEAAQPVETALLANGAVKKCTSGSAGHGPDNYTPWYEVSLVVPKSREATLQLLQEVSAKEGYHLAQATPKDKHLLGVTEIFLADNYFDFTSKASTFPGLEKGTLNLTFRLYKSVHCPDQGYLQQDDSHTPVILHMSLPARP